MRPTPSVLTTCALLAGLAAQQPFPFHQDHVLGTSLDASIVATDKAVAEAGFATVTAEIERLRAVLSTYDPKSELSTLLATGSLAAASPELRDVLTACAAWNERTGGAFDARVGGLVELWQSAVKAGKVPDPKTLEGAVATLRAASWTIDAASGAVTLTGNPRLVVNSYAKSYIVQRALAALRHDHPNLAGAMLAIGGDIATFGAPAKGQRWSIAVTDPAHPADNAPSLGSLAVGDSGIATSAGYARGFDIGGKHYSHILDPRTGAPVTGVQSSTVVASDATTAGPLATTLCVLTPEQGLALVAKTPGAECLIVGADGKQHTSPGFAALWSAKANVAEAAHKEGAGWPKGTELAITLTLPENKARGYRRPYVAIWIETSKLALVRTVVLWGAERRWLGEMTHWTEASGYDGRTTHATTRATRAPGEYTVVWDGLDDQGNAVPPGEYIVCVEVAREHGGHTIARRSVKCGTGTVTLPIPKNAELASGSVHFGPKAQAAK